MATYCYRSRHLLCRYLYVSHGWRVYMGGAFMSAKNLQTITELVLLLNDHLINGEREKAEAVAKILKKIEL